MRCSILACVGGGALLQAQGALPAPALLLLLATAAIAAGLLAVVLHRRWRAAAATLAGALTGFCWAAFVAGRVLAPALAQADEGRDVVIVGTVDSLPGEGPDSVRFHFAVEEVIAPVTMRVPPRVALSWYADDAPGKVRPGERWRLKVRLQRPHGNANPGGFDYELWLLEQGVRATGYVRNEGRNVRLDPFVATPHNAVERTRAVLRGRILRALAGREYAGVIVALVVGDQRAIGKSDWQVFNRTGIGHLISIPGLWKHHLSFLVNSIKTT
jgi:competence protein ComEC